MGRMLGDIRSLTPQKLIRELNSMEKTMKISLTLSSFQWLLLAFLLMHVTICATSTNIYEIPRLSVLKETDEPVAASDLSEFKTFFYNQTLDHFNYRPESYTTFKQRYVMNFEYWGGANTSAPIFVYLGAEAPLDNSLTGIGFLTDNAKHFNALLVYLEHRYYGQSVPFKSREEAFSNASTLGYFSSAQAIADYAEIIIYVKELYRARDCPVIVIGGSYGGMLASWFRLKYPHVALGALASSAPILYFEDITPQNGYYSVVTKDFKETSMSCYRTILSSWSEIDKIALEKDGPSTLSSIFKTCNPLTSKLELVNYLVSMYSSAAQYDAPPSYPVTTICQAIDGMSEASDVLSKIFAGVVAYKGNSTCYFNTSGTPSETSQGWNWQTCSEMVMPIGLDNTTMFPPAPFNLTDYIKSCNDYYGVPPRPHWVTSYYGGYDVKLILNRFASNIIFSNGLRDPYSIAGVLENISDSVVALITVNGSHCLDILSARTYDPQWLVMQRKIEVDIIQGWITQYYDDLRVFKT